MPADAFVVVNDVTASVQDRFTAIYLDWPRMVRGMSVDHVDAGVDQSVRERDVAGCGRIAPIGSPMHRDYGDIAGAFVRQHLCRHIVGDVALRRIPDQPHSGPVAAGGPGFGDAAGFRRYRADDHPAFMANRD